MRPLGIIITIFTLIHALPARLHEQSAQERLASALDLFNKDKCSLALNLIKTLDVRKDLDNSDDMKLALKIRAICASEMKKEQEAQESIQELYFIDAGYNFSPFDTPAAVIELATRERKKIEDKNKQLATLSAKTANSPTLTVASQTIKVPSIEVKTSTALFPFGINHYLMNAPLKGTIYLSVQSLGLLANIGAFWWKQSYLDSFGSSRLMNASEKNSFTAAQTIQYIALGTFIAALGVSMIDALLQLPNSVEHEFSIN